MSGKQRLLSVSLMRSVAFHAKDDSIIQDNFEEYSVVCMITPCGPLKLEPRFAGTYLCLQGRISQAMCQCESICCKPCGRSRCLFETSDRYLGTSQIRKQGYMAVGLCYGRSSRVCPQRGTAITSPHKGSTRPGPVRPLQLLGRTFRFLALACTHR